MSRGIPHETAEPARPEPSPEEAPARGRRLVVAWATGLGLLALLVVVVLREGDPRELVAIALHANPAWLGVAAVLQAATYLCAAASWSRVLRRTGRPAPLWPLVGMSLAKLFTDQAIPTGGISGSLLVVRALRRRGYSRGIATVAILVNLVARYISYALLVSASLLLLWKARDLGMLVLAPAGLFAFVAVLVPAAILWLNARGAERTPAWVQRVPGLRSLLAAIYEAPAAWLRDPRLIAEVVPLNGAVFLLDAATLGAMLAAVGHPTPPSSFFVAFMAASVVQTVGLVPGGLGTFEGTSVAMLVGLGGAVEPALAATLLLRAFTFWLPMLPGMWIARRALRRRVAPSPEPPP